MATRNVELSRFETVGRDALASASGQQNRAAVKAKRQEHGRQEERHHAPWERANAPMRSMVMQR
ncbi:hypothetical protein MMB17_18425 [Methylobacterium organophilum]|uniref:hypothetical protein n=1 Tax=Methylobacterium organophilum TaxID=410 RepID=UPI001F12CDF3|nr:hypothetical protein [Methylobacterium organophilum]UMY16640.1 hypothetical protein MMB17_18425 [Methylobacterium organophilum]